MTFRGSDHPDELLSASISGDLSPEEQCAARPPPGRMCALPGRAGRLCRRSPGAGLHADPSGAAGPRGPGAGRHRAARLSSGVVRRPGRIGRDGRGRHRCRGPDRTPSQRGRQLPIRGTLGERGRFAVGGGADPGANDSRGLPGPRRPGVLHPQRRRRVPAARLPQRPDGGRDWDSRVVRPDPRGLALTRRAVARLHRAEGRVRGERGVGPQPLDRRTTSALAAAPSSRSPNAWCGRRTVPCSPTPWRPSTLDRRLGAMRWKPRPVRPTSGSSRPIPPRRGA